MPVNANFGVLRECQDTMPTEASWMTQELDECITRQGGEYSQLLEARRLAAALHHTARHFLDGEILTLEELALAQRRKPVARVSRDPQPLVRHLLNALHASVVPVDGLIESLGETPNNLQPGILLRAGIVGILRAIDGIGTELRPLLAEKGRNQATAREDFGVYDPATD